MKSSVVAEGSKTTVSLSARRAWIEMDVDGYIKYLIGVALRKESVD